MTLLTRARVEGIAKGLEALMPPQPVSPRDAVPTLETLHLASEISHRTGMPVADVETVLHEAPLCDRWRDWALGEHNGQFLDPDELLDDSLPLRLGEAMENAVDLLRRVAEELGNSPGLTEEALSLLEGALE